MSIEEAAPFRPSEGNSELLGAVAPLRAAIEALSPVGAAAADGSAAS